MTQRYTTEQALAWLAAGCCPECGGRTGEHTGWGGPRGCSLTDNGVAQRVHAHRRQQPDTRTSDR